jgi:hypothetical protein
MPEFSLEEHCTAHVEDTIFFSSQVFETKDDALIACHELGRREVERRLAPRTQL